MKGNVDFLTANFQHKHNILLKCHKQRHFITSLFQSRTEFQGQYKEFIELIQHNYASGLGFRNEYIKENIKKKLGLTLQKTNFVNLGFEIYLTCCSLNLSVSTKLNIIPTFQRMCGNVKYILKAETKSSALPPSRAQY